MTLRRLSLLLAASTLTASAAFADEHGVHWSYDGATGPSHWAELGHDNSACGMGKTQSPIDITDKVVHKADLPKIEFSYQPSNLKIVDNGHTIQVNYAPGSFITVGGRRFDLVQFHFHKPSEEQINDKNFDMVAHLVHKDKDGKLAVVAVLLSAGSANHMIDALWSHLPNHQNHKEAVLDNVKIDLRELLPDSKAYYTFTGSLTTPPCTEGVTWFVLRTPMTLSAAQISRFGSIYPMDARPVQPLNNREVQASN